MHDGNDKRIPDVDEFVEGYEHRLLLHKETYTLRDLDRFVAEEGEDLLGYLTRYRFRNGLGASVVHHKNSYDRELAVLAFGPYDLENPWDYKLTYITPVTSDVIGYIEGDDRLKELLDQIGDLPPEARWVEGLYYEDM